MAAPDHSASLRRRAGRPPHGVSEAEWLAQVRAGARAIADAQGVENDGTPEEYAAAALRAAAKLTEES